MKIRSFGRRGTEQGRQFFIFLPPWTTLSNKLFLLLLFLNISLRPQLPECASFPLSRCVGFFFKCCALKTPSNGIGMTARYDRHAVQRPLAVDEDQETTPDILRLQLVACVPECLSCVASAFALLRLRNSTVRICKHMRVK
jgi:hypothetical protein